MFDSGWAAWFSLVQSKNCSLPNTLLWVRDGNSFLCDRIQSINAYVTKWAWSPTFSSSFSKKLKSVASPGRKHSSSWNSRHRIKHCPEQTAPFLLILSAMYVWLWVAVKKHSWCSAVSLLFLRRIPSPCGWPSQLGHCVQLLSTPQHLQAKSGENGPDLPSQALAAACCL